MPSYHKSKEWKERREKFIQDKICEWCGSTEHLGPHHKNPKPIGLNAYKMVARDFFDEYFSVDKNQAELKQLMQESLKEYPLEYRNICPSCKKGSIYERTTIAPKYRCIKCGNEFESPDREINPKSENWLWKNIRFRFEQNHRGEIKEQYEGYKKSSREEYLDLNRSDVIVLCRKCHFHAGQGQVLCIKCKERYHSKRYNTCFECAVKERPELEQYRRVEIDHPWCNKKFKLSARARD